jgi:uncharacterized repeat protein (TIGR01451 family)
MAAATALLGLAQALAPRPMLAQAPPTPTVNAVCGLSLEADCAMFESHFAHTHHTPEEIPLLPAGLEAQSVGGLNLYYGDLHNHTGYSDGVSTPAQAFATARANGLHFMAVTDHAFLLTPAEWQNLRQQAGTATVDHQFVALAGYEFTHAKGHMNVFNTDTLVNRTQSGFETIEGFYNWLINQPTAFAQFNHPYQSDDSNFNNFAYNPRADHKMVVQELTTAQDFFIAMNAGWHLGTLKNRDTHTTEWGQRPLMGLLAASLTKADILEAITARRTFFVSPNDSNLAVVLRANGYWMGSAIPPAGQINFTINAFDPNPNGATLRLALYENGVRVASTTRASAASYTWTPTVPARQDRYYYAEAYYAHWTNAIPAYSSPIWVEHPPLAVVEPPVLTPVGQPAQLDGRQSYDPDGDALIFDWAQHSGSIPLSVAQSSPFAVTALVTPTVAGDSDFLLTVSDPGGLSGSAVMRVSATEQPFLKILAAGPGDTPPGSPITYTLTVTNIGVSVASQVVITAQVPGGAVYLNGGDVQSGGIIRWNWDALAANGGAIAVTFAVSADSGIVLNSFGAICTACVPTWRGDAVFTNGSKIYLPVVLKNR